MKALASLAVALFLFLIIVKIREYFLKPKQAIKQAFKSTKYEKLIPLVIAQSQHETNNYQSRVFKELNNLFGMRTAKIRAQIGKPDYSGYRSYSNKFDSALDLLHWFHYTDFPTNPDIDSFVIALKNRNYFEDSQINYKSGINRYYNG